jgi:DNA sulfur modification protein DndD
MKLLHLKLTNWGPFVGEHVIEFSFNGNSQIAVIMGKNGFGKTRILDSMKWLYAGGKEFVDPVIYVNRKSVLKGDPFRVEVETKFEDEDAKFFLRRSFDVSPGELTVDNIGQIASRPQPGSQLFTERIELQPEGKIPMAVDETNKVLRRLFPASLVNFNFFNAANPAEQVSWLEESGDSLPARLRKESIETALGFGSSDVLSSRLASLEKTLSTEVANGATASSKRTKLVQDKATNETLQEHARSAITENRKLLTDLETERDNLSDELRGAQAKIQLEQELIQNQGEIKAKREELNLNLDSIKTLVSDLWFYPIVHSLNIDLDLVKQNRESKTNYIKRRTELDLIIESLKGQTVSGDCATCGTKLTSGTTENLTQQLVTAELELSELEKPKLEFNDKYISLVESLLNQDAKTNVTGLQEKFNRIATLRNQIVQLDLNQHSLLAETGGGSLEFVHKFERLNSLESIIIPPLEKSIEKDKADFDRLGKEIKKAVEGIAKLPGVDPALAGKLKSLSYMREVVERVTSTIRTDVREKIEKSANEILSALLTKGDGAQKLKIGDDYSIVTSKGTYKTLNDQFRESVALSLMFALPRVANSSFPMFVDTPFGHLDEGHIDRFIDFMKKEVKQIVILPNDANLSINVVQKTFEGSLSNYFILLRDPRLLDDSGTEIESIDSREIVSYLEKFRIPNDYAKGWGYE